MSTRSKAIARSYAIRARKAAAADPQAANDNVGVRCAYVDTTMTPGMLADCIAAGGFAN